MTLYDLLNEGNAALQQAGDTDGENDAKLLLFEAFHLDLVHFLMDRLRPLSEQDAKVQEQIRTYREMIEKRASRIPLQQILGSQEFMGLEFYVNEHVLIPRQDTETLVEEGLKCLEDVEKPEILDMCTGSGCILISLLLERQDARGAGVDVSPEALEVAKENASLLKVENRADFLESDLFSAPYFCEKGGKEGGKYDILISNPPYIATEEIETLMEEVRLHDPRKALDGMEDGLYFYRKITKEAGKYLKPGGWLLYEIGCDQGEAVSRIMRTNDFSNIAVKKDLAGLDRIVCGVYY